MSTSSATPQAFQGNPATALFSAPFLASLITGPLRYFFNQYGHDIGLQWSGDINETEIEIDTINNFHKIAIGQKPRIMVDRGQFGISGIGLTDNMAEQVGFGQTYGLTDRKNFVLYTGQSSVIVQARQEGTCERVADLTHHFLVWSAPYLCDTQGFKSFAKNVVVGPCQPGQEDLEIFEIQIAIPWIKEEAWQVKNDAVLIKGIDLFLSS